MAKEYRIKVEDPEQDVLPPDPSGRQRQSEAAQEIRYADKAEFVKEKVKTPRGIGGIVAVAIAILLAVGMLFFIAAQL